MNIHKNARLTPKGREILVRRIVNGGLRVEEAAQASGVSVRTAYKWLARYRAQGRRGLRGPFFASRTAARIAPRRSKRAAILALRRARCTYREISRRNRGGAQHGGPGRPAGGIEPIVPSGPSGCSPPLGLPPSGGPVTPGHQAFRTFCASGPSGHRHPGPEFQGRRMGIRACGHRRITPG